jgi:O-antigen ligase
MNPIRQGATAALGHITLTALLVLPCVLGSYAAYIALLATLLALVVGFDRATLLAATQAGWVRMMAAAFALLAVAFVVGAKTQQDALYSLDFLPLLLAAPAVMMLGAIRVANGAQYLARLALAGSAAAVLAGSYDLLVLGLDRAKGLENSPIHFADYAMMLGFMALVGVIVDRSRWRWMYVLGPVFGLVAVLQSGTRGALLVGGVLAVIFVLTLWRRWIRRWRAALAALAVGVALVAAAAFAAEAMCFARPFGALSVVGDLIAGRPVTDYSTALRLDFYSSGLRAIADAPWFGHGWHNQIKSALPYFSEATLAAYANEGWGFIHNEPLGFAISGGLVGFVAYWLFTLAPIAAHVTAPKGKGSDIRLSLILTLVGGFFLGGMTDVLMMWELPKMMFVILTAAIVVLAGPRQQEA